MADKKISDLPVATSIGLSDISILVDNGVNCQFDFNLLLQFISANIFVGAVITFGNIVPQNTIGKNGDVFIKTDTATLYQKLNNVWTFCYSIAAGSETTGQLLYGTGIPGTTTGVDTDSYIDTLTGIFYLKTSGNWSQVFSMATGPQGPRGTAGTNGINGINGNTILHGTVNPSNTNTGVNGDYYINISTWYFFGPKTAGAWPSGFSLITSIDSNSYNKPFKSVTGVSIDWQNDLINSTVTYAALLGNTLFKKPTVFAKGTINTDGSYEMSSVDYSLTITQSADATQIIKAEFDWAIPQTGIISF